MPKRKHDEHDTDHLQPPSARAFLVHCGVFAAFTLLTGGQPQKLELLIISGIWALALFIHGVVLFQRDWTYRMAQRSPFYKSKHRRKRLSEEHDEALPDLYADVEEHDEMRF